MGNGILPYTSSHHGDSYSFGLLLHHDRGQKGIIDKAGQAVRKNVNHAPVWHENVQVEPRLLHPENAPMSEQHESVGQHQVGQSDADTTDDSLPHGLRSASAHAPEAPPAIGSDIDVSFSSPVDETLLQNVQQRAHLHLARSVQPDQLQEACVMEAPQGVSHEINCNGPTQDNHVYDGSGSLRLVKQGCKYDKDIQAVVWHESPSTASQGCGLNTGCGPALVPSSRASTASIPTSPIAQVDDEVVGTASGSLLQFLSLIHI